MLHQKLDIYWSLRTAHLEAKELLGSHTSSKGAFAALARCGGAGVDLLQTSGERCTSSLMLLELKYTEPAMFFPHAQRT